MKKTYRMLFIALVFACVFLTPALASNFDSSAQELKDFGMFKGTNVGFDLDRAPTRAEAAVMLVRLLGAENEAKTQYESGEITNPFTDVSDWAKPYIAWLYDNNLTKGVSDTIFGVAGQCTAKMYCTFVLRALGYSDTDGDFTFDQSEDLAEYLGIYDADMVESTFLRDHAVAISYRALAASINGTDTSLLEKLIADGAVSETSASALLDKVKAYRAYCAAFDEYNSSSAVSASAYQFLKVQNIETFANYTYSGNASYMVKATDDGLQMSFINTYTYRGPTSTTCSWIKDGYYYYSDAFEKTKTALTDSIMDEVFSADVSVYMPALYEVKSAAMNSTAEGMKYVLTYADDFDYFGYLNDTLDLEFETSNIVNLSVSNCTLTVLTDEVGKITSFKNNYSCTFKYNNEGYLAPISMDYSNDEKINATGDRIVIVFPDFSAFKEQS